MKRQLLNTGYSILDAMDDIGPDVTIFNNFLNYFYLDDLESCKNFRIDGCYFSSQPLQEEIIEYIHLIKEYVEKFTK